MRNQTTMGEYLEDVYLCSILGQVVLPDLIKLSTSKRDIRILKESAVKYTEIGTLLLRDDTGAIVSGIEQSDQVKTVSSIYQQWIQEDEDHSWKKLIQCFRDVQLNSLARDLELHFGLPSPSDIGKVNKQGDTLLAVAHMRTYIQKSKEKHVRKMHRIGQRRRNSMAFALGTTSFSGWLFLSSLITCCLE